jgi:UDP-N-acetylmuramoylalanine--D-glutamate ligase
MVVRMTNVPKDSIYLAEARKNNIPIELDVSLFIKLAPKITVVGITGTRGKSMTTALIYEILSNNIKGRKVYLGGNVRGVATLPLLKKIKAGDVLVCELDSWQLQGFGESKMSPHISVFTSFMPDHMNYYKNSMEDYFADKANIFKYKNGQDFLITSSEVKKLIKEKLKSKIILASRKNVRNWKFVVPGEHQRQNLAYAVEVGKIFSIPIQKIKKTVALFKGVEGRLQLLRNYEGIKIYNDNNATTPEATIAGLKAFEKENVILITGGTTKKVPLENFVNALNKYPKKIFLIPGTGTDELLLHNLKTEKYKAKDFKDAVLSAVSSAKKGDMVLFSPAFASFGMFNNEYERNDLFVKIIKKLK